MNSRAFTVGSLRGSGSPRVRCLQLALSALTILAVLGRAEPLLAQERKAEVVLVSVSGDGKAMLKKARTALVVLSGNDSFLTRLLEDAVAIHLANSGLGVVSRVQVERASADESSAGKGSKAESTPSIAELGRRLGADAIVIGTLLAALSEQRAVQVRLVTFEIADAQTGAPLVRVLLEFDGGKSIPSVAEGFVKVINELRK